MDTFRQDLRFALRTLTRRPAFSIMAVAMLALGIGINTAMFSVVRGVLLEPLPYADADRVVRVHHVNRTGGVTDGQFSPDDLDDFVAAVTTTELAAYWHAPGLSNMTLTDAGDAALLEASFVSAEFFDVLGVPPSLGRLPEPSEMVVGNDRVAVLSDRLWRTRFDADPDLVGRTITLNGGAYRVLGVMGPSYTYPAETVDVWLPLSIIGPESIPRQRGLRYLDVVARLRPGASPALAASELTGIAVQLAESHPSSNADWQHVSVVPVRDVLLGSVRTPLLVLSGAVLFVLLIASANVINLLLARATARGSEIALRSALGAGRLRIARQLITENLVLALVGGVVGVLCAAWLTTLLLGLGGAELPRTANVSMNGPVVLFALALALLTGLLTGLMPAWRAARADAAALKEGSSRGSTEARERRRARGLLVAAEMAVAVILVVGAGLMLRSFDALLRIDPGFSADNVLAVTLTVPSHRAQSLEQSIAYRNELAERVAAVPGVAQVGLAKSLPLAAGGEPYEFAIPGRTGGDAVFRPEAGVQIVSAEYFDALSIPIQHGRGLQVTDGLNDPRVMLINRLAASRYWPGEDPVGQVVMLGESNPVRIVGVVGDVRHDGLHNPAVPAAYVSIDQWPRLSLRILARTDADPASLIGPVRTAIRDLEAQQPIAAIEPLRASVAQAMARDRFLTVLIGAFAALALTLAALGIYGVVAYGVAQRTNEIGIRMALGADRAGVVRMIVGQAAVWWGPGLLVGLASAAAATRLMRGLVFGVSVSDPLTYATVAALLGGAAVVASIAPALRAARVDPARSLGG